MTDLTVRPSTAEPDRAMLTRHVVDRYEQGRSLSAISDEIGRSYGFVRRLLLEAGTRPRPRGGKRERRLA